MLGDKAYRHQVGIDRIVKPYDIELLFGQEFLYIPAEVPLRQHLCPQTRKEPDSLIGIRESEGPGGEQFMMPPYISDRLRLPPLVLRIPRDPGIFHPFPILRIDPP